MIRQRVLTAAGRAGCLEGKKDQEEDKDQEKDEDNENDEMDVDDLVRAACMSAKAWVDAHILDSWRKSGRQMEESVLHLWKHWLVGALASGVVPDIIVDSNHTVEYLKYARLFTKKVNG
ncbi:hypothetical protein L208DRAFT_1379668 [Tricholoma matsutake]|nr:hypothetical protein L208DRAFT_1379668 [Tricholoma matsutake 945]